MSGSPLLPLDKCEIWGVLLSTWRNVKTQAVERSNEGLQFDGRQDARFPLDLVRPYAGSNPAVLFYLIHHACDEISVPFVQPGGSSLRPLGFLVPTKRMAVSSLAQSTGFLEACEVDFRPATNYGSSDCLQQSLDSANRNVVKSRCASKANEPRNPDTDRRLATTSNIMTTCSTPLSVKRTSWLGVLEQHGIGLFPLLQFFKPSSFSEAPPAGGRGIFLTNN